MEVYRAKKLYDRLDRAFKLLKGTTNQDEIIALQNYLANVYTAISNVKGKRVRANKRKVFGSRKKYRKFEREVELYDISMLENFVLNKDFHADYIGEILFGVEEDFKDEFIDFNDIEYSFLGINDYYELFFEFLKSLKLEELFDEFITNGNIYNLKKNNEANCFGSTLYNPVNGDIDIFINDFQYNLHTMFTMAHEFGHVYDLKKYNDSIESYNIYFYQSFNCEVISKLFERLFIEYLLDNDILLLETRDLMMEMEIINHDYLLGAYMLALLPDKYLENGSYVNLSREKLIDIMSEYFGNKEGIREYVENSCYFDVSEDFNYSYGNIISIFLKDSIDKYGFSNELLDEFFKMRSSLFNEDFLRKWRMSPKDYIKIYTKETQALKK